MERGWGIFGALSLVSASLRGAAKRRLSGAAKQIGARLNGGVQSSFRPRLRRPR